MCNVARYISYFGMVIGLLAAGCDKNPEDLKPEIVFGDLDHMVVNHYDTTLTGEYQVTKTLMLDIDNDGTNDILLNNEIWGSPGLGHHPLANIGCMHEKIRLAGIHTIDTSFLNHQIWITDEPGEQVEVYEYLTYTCHRRDADDSIFAIKPDFKISNFNRDEMIGVQTLFQADTFQLLTDSNGYPPDMWESGDTAYYRFVIHQNDCSFFPTDKTTYIGLKMTDGPRLGWIRLGVFGYNDLLLLESAIQHVY